MLILVYCFFINYMISFNIRLNFPDVIIIYYKTASIIIELWEHVIC